MAFYKLGETEFQRVMREAKRGGNVQFIEATPEHRKGRRDREAAADEASEATVRHHKSMRTITDHKLNGLNDALEIQVLDEPGQGGACHKYSIGWGRKALNPSMTGGGVVDIEFQNGPIQEHGVNGISGEALLAIVIDRLRCFQAGQYACRENVLALTALEESLMWLQKRTRDRLARVEGTSTK